MWHLNALKPPRRFRMDKDYSETVVLLYQTSSPGSQSRIGKLCVALQELGQQAIALPASRELTAAWCHASRAVVVERAHTLEDLPPVAAFDFRGRRLCADDLQRTPRAPEYEFSMVADEVYELRPLLAWRKPRAERALLSPAPGDPNGLLESAVWAWRQNPNQRLQLLLDEWISPARKRWLKAQRAAHLQVLDELQNPGRALLASDLVISDHWQTLMDASCLGRAVGFVKTREPFEQDTFGHILQLGSCLEAWPRARDWMQRPKTLARLANQGWELIDGAGHYALAAEIIAQLD